MNQCDTFMTKRLEIGVTYLSRKWLNLSIHLVLSQTHYTINSSATNVFYTKHIWTYTLCCMCAIAEQVRPFWLHKQTVVDNSQK